MSERDDHQRRDDADRKPTTDDPDGASGLAGAVGAAVDSGGGATDELDAAHLRPDAEERDLEERDRRPG